MKKLSLLIIFLVSLFIFTNGVYAAKKTTKTTEDTTTAEKVKVYMITKEGCSGCEMAYEYFEELSKTNDNFELVPFEVFDSNWNFNSEELYTLFVKIYEYFDEDTNQASTPTIVIGEYHTLGLPSDKTQITDAIKNAKKDVVAKIAKDNNLNIDELKYDVSKRAESNNTKESETSNGKYDTLIIVSIFVILIGGFAGLVVLGKK